MLKDIYEECPVYKTKLITLRQTTMEDAKELLKCYSDKKAVQFFNSDNCNGDNFYYTTIGRMEQAIDFWQVSYKNKHFIRWTVILNSTNEKIGTIEMFHRIADDEFNDYGLLRIDLQSKYETQSIIAGILKIVHDNFYAAFDVEAILTKAVPEARERMETLIQKGYKPLNRKFMIYDNYFLNSELNKLGQG